MIRGLRFARAAYTAAVYPAGPEPMMMTFRTSVMDATLQGDVRQWPSASERPAMARTSSYEPGFPGATNVMPTRPGAPRVARHRAVGPGRRARNGTGHPPIVVEYSSFALPC